MQQVTEDTTEKALEDHTARSLPFGGGYAVLMGGVIATLAGLFAAAIAAVLVFGGKIPGDQTIMVPPALLFVFIIGLGLMWTGHRDWQRARRLAEDLQEGLRQGLGQLHRGARRGPVLRPDRQPEAPRGRALLAPEVQPPPAEERVVQDQHGEG
jgi:hypothetical protein